MGGGSGGDVAHPCYLAVASGPDRDSPRGSNRFGWCDGQPQRRWAQTCTTRAAALVGEMDPGNDVRLAHEIWLEIGEHQLRSPEHREPAVLVDVAPRQVDEPGTTPALYRRPPKVVMAIALHDRDRHRPCRTRSVGPDEVAGFATDLDTDVNVVVDLVVHVPLPPRQAMAADLQEHLLSVSRPTIRSHHGSHRRLRRPLERSALGVRTPGRPAPPSISRPHHVASCRRRRIRPSQPARRDLARTFRRPPPR